MTVNPRYEIGGLLYILCIVVMFEFEANGSVVVEQIRALEAALASNPKTKQALSKLINKVMKDAREKTVQGIRLRHDPRAARESIRRTTYKKILGANLNIYNSRKAGRPTDYEPPRTLRQGQRGGNRVKRGERTSRLMHYGPHDRGFVLRFLNSGTGTRSAGTLGGRLSGNRGSVMAMNIFSNTGEQSLMQASVSLAALIDTELDSILNKQKQ